MAIFSEEKNPKMERCLKKKVNKNKRMKLDKKEKISRLTSLLEEKKNDWLFYEQIQFSSCRLLV